MSQTPNCLQSASGARAPIRAFSRKLDTSEAANLLRVRPQTLRRALCIDGHYLGLKPTKLPSGRLLWDSADLEALIEGGDSR